MSGLGDMLMPGVLVRNPDRPEWGLGQVQSSIGGKVTVNFEQVGKQVINTALIRLDPVIDPQPDTTTG